MTTFKHTVRSFDEDLHNLAHSLELMSDKVSINFQRAYEALLNYDQNTAAKVIEEFPEISRLHLDIESLALSMLALRQPVAIDLRSIISTIKISSHLEQIGDNICSLCARILRMKKPPEAAMIEPVRDLCLAAQDMLSQLRELLVDGDPEIALKLYSEDDTVDLLYGRIYKTIIDHMKTGTPKGVSQDMHLMFAVKYVERLSDTVAVIAGQVYQQITGEIMPKRTLDS